MRKNKFVLLIIMVLFLVNVDADETCTNNELTRLKELANKVDIHYDYEIKKENNGEEEFIDYNFKIVADNLNPELKVVIPEDYYLMKYKEFKYNDSKSFTIDGFNMGEVVNVEIKAYSNNECAGKTLLTKKISMPYYNSMYNTEECKGFEDFIYCKNEIVEKEITFDEFYNQLDLFKKNKESKTNEEIVDIVEEKNDNNLLIIMVIAGIILGIASYFVIKNLVKKRKERDI